MWWNHNRLFARYFVPNTVSVVLNFAMLGCLVLFAFSIQVFVKYAGPDSILFYAAMFGCTFLLLGVLYLIGATLRRARLTSEEFRKGFIRGLRLTCMALGILVAATIVHRIGMHVRTVPYLFVPPVLFMVLVTRLAPLAWAPLRKPPKPSLRSS